MMSGLRPRFGLFRRGASAQQNAVSAAATGGAAAESSSDAHHLQAADADSGPPVNAAGFVVDTPHQLQPDAAAELPLVEQETVAANEELSSLPALSSLPDLHGRVSTGAEDDGRRLSAGGGVLPAGVPGLLLGVMFSLVYGLFNVAPKAMIVSLVSLFIAGFLAENLFAVLVASPHIHTCESCGQHKAVRLGGRKGVDVQVPSAWGPFQHQLLRRREAGRHRKPLSGAHDQ